MNLVSECTMTSAPYSIGPHQYRRRDRVVDDQRHAMAVRDVGERLEIAHIAGRIADGLAENRAGVLVDQGLEIGGAIGFREPHLHAELRQNVREQSVGRAVELRHRDDVAAHLRGVQRPRSRGPSGPNSR